MKKILFYGGCHAQVLSQIFNVYSNTHIKAEFLINFKLMDKNEDFPYQSLHQYDVVLFTPIRRERYATTELVSYCQKHNIDCISFPWLQWNGYFPHISKRSSINRLGEWEYGGLTSSIDPKVDLPLFKELFLQNGEAPENIRHWANKCISILQQKEIEDNVDVKISDIIADQHQKRRLFLTPDHPTSYFYSILVPRLAKILQLDMDDSLLNTTYEFHPELKIPILPATAKALGLDFADTECFNKYKSLLPISFQEYLKIEYYSCGGRNMLKCTNETLGKYSPVAGATLSIEDKYEFRLGDIIAGKILNSDGIHDYMAIKEIWNKDYSRFMEFDKQLYIFKGHWAIDGGTSQHGTS